MTKTLRKATTRDATKSEPAATTKSEVATYALASWTVKLVGEKWYIAKSVYFGEKNRDWRGPYKSLRLATTAIARKLEEEATTRHSRKRGRS